MNLADGLRINSWSNPTRIAAVFEDKQVTYEVLNKRANQLAHAVIKRGFKRQDKISALSCTTISNFWRSITAWRGLRSSRFRSTFAWFLPNWNMSSTTPTPQAFLWVSNCSTNFISTTFPMVRRDNIFVVGPKDKTPEGFMNYEDLLAGQPDFEPTNVDQCEEDIFYFGYTSGTTGFPKGAMNTVRGTLDIVKNVFVRTAGKAHINLQDRVFLAIIPICHSNSVWATLITLWVGGTNVILPSGKFDPEHVLQLIDRWKVTTSSMVPTMITRILELPDEVKSKYNLDSLTSLGSSSAPLLTKTKEEALKFFKNVRFSEGYGSTETGALTTLRHRDMERKVRSIGKPNPGVEIKLLDEDGNTITEPRKQGVLWAKARSAFIGYYKDPGKTKQSINGDWSTAGDVAYFDEEGYYFLSDRKHDMIISGGENVYPAEIEEVIARLPQVSEVAVIGVPHPSWGEEVKAIVKLKEGATITEQEIIDYCKKNLAGYKRPRSIDFVEDFPRTATGKVLKRILKKPY